MPGFVKAVLTIVLVASSFRLADAATLSAPGGGVIRALVVGIDNYSKLAEGAQLHGAVADAKDIAGTLQKGGVSPVLIVDGQATRQRLVDEMNKIVAASRAGDLVLISFAGHGMQVPEYPQWKGLESRGVNEQIALSGFSMANDGSHEFIVNKELRAWLYRLDVKGVDVLVVMDSCFGGGMRRLDPRSGELRVRQLAGDASGSQSSFTPIPTIPVEASAEIKDMPHVTFLGGASSNSVVPETPGLAPNSSRGALSFFVARALEGQASTAATLDRNALFRYVPQNVRQSTNQRQNVDMQPRSREPAIIGKALVNFIDKGAKDKPDLSGSGQKPFGNAQGFSPEVDQVRVAIVNGNADAFGAIVKHRAPFVEEHDPGAADLVWDPSRSEALSHGDLIMQRVDGNMMGAIVDRTFALKLIHRFSEPRTLDADLTGGGRIYVRGERPEITVRGAPSSGFVVFNITADAEVQMLFPAQNGQNGVCPPATGREWSCKLTVTEPFGADSVVAVALNKNSDVIDWLNSHHGQRNAALLPEMLSKLLAADPSIRIGSVNLYTRPN